MSRLRFIIVGTLLASLQCVFAQDDAARTKYRNLIRSLGSPNAKATQVYAPERSRRLDGIRFPAGYDADAQRKIDAARKTLHNDFESALPYLIDALEDGRYCMTVYSVAGEEYPNLTVGDVCRDIVTSHLEVYRKAIVADGPTRWEHFDYPISKEWYQTRRGRSEADLQLEAIDWAIARWKKEPAEDQPADIRKHELKQLQKLRGEIEKAGKPLPPSGLPKLVTADVPAR